MFKYMYISARGLGERRRERLAVHSRLFRTCSRAAHILGGKAARPSCSSVRPRLPTERALSLTETQFYSARAHHLRMSCARACVRAVRALLYLANVASVLAVSPTATACIAYLLFAKPRGRSRRTRHTDRLCFEALCWVCPPPPSTHCEYSWYPL
jgi:hypothetical protein